MSPRPAPMEGTAGDQPPPYPVRPISARVVTSGVAEIR